MKKTPKFATFAVPLSGNKGSASMLLGLLDAFKKASIKAYFSIYSYYPEQDKKQPRNNSDIDIYPGHPIHIFFRILPAILTHLYCPWLVTKKQLKLIEPLIGCDAVLVIGGTTFADEMTWKVPWNILAILPGLFLKKPTLLLSQTIGPFNNFFNRIAAKTILRKCTWIHARGKTSFNHLKTLGIPQSSYWPDLSFSMAVYEPEFYKNESRVLADVIRFYQLNHSKVVVGVAPNTIVLQKCYKHKIDYIKRMQQNICIVLIPHSYRKNTTASHNNDRWLCEAISQPFSENSRLLFVSDDLSSQALRSIIGEMDILLASRFHSMISALCTGVLPVTVGWGDQKYVEVLNEYSLEKFYCSYKEINSVLLSKTIQKACHSYKEFKEKIMKVNEKTLKQTDCIPTELLNIINQFSK